MYINKIYNAQVSTIRGTFNKSKYWREHEEVHNLLASGNVNVVLEYDNAKDAKGAYTSIKKYISETKSPVGLNFYKKKNIVMTRIPSDA